MKTYIEIHDNDNGTYHIQVWIDDGNGNTVLASIIPQVDSILPWGNVEIRIKK